MVCHVPPCCHQSEQFPSFSPLYCEVRCASVSSYKDMKTENMVVAHRCLTISLMETSYCSARNNTFDGDFGKNFWQKRDWSTFCHIPVATVISPLHMWFKKEKNIRRKKTQLIELLLVPRYFFVNISTNSLQIWGSFIVIPLNKLKLMTLNLRTVKAAWLAKHIRALSQCSHHTN